MGSGGSRRSVRELAEDQRVTHRDQELVDSADASDDRMRILHVDDDRDLVELTAEYLEREASQLEIRTATTVSDALAVLDRERIECVVSDYEMKPTDGLDFLEIVRERDEELPFILLTGEGSETVASEAISRGVTDYLQKGYGVDRYAILANRITNAVEQYRSKQRARESQERFSMFFDQSPLGVIEWDEHFEAVRMNDAAESILGYSESEFTGKSWEKIVPESDREAVRDVVSNLLEVEGGYSSINENVRKDGERIVCEWHNRVVTDDNDEVVSVFSQFQDVTDRTEREEALTNLHEVATELADSDSRREIYQTALNAAQSMPVFEQAGVVLEDGGQLEVERATDEAILEDLPPSLDEEVTADGETVVVEELDGDESAAVGSLIHVPLHGRRVFQVYSPEPDAFDERDIEMAELLAQHTRNELEHLSYERELKEKKERLQEQNEKLDEFVSVVSHDLRNPIQVISATIELAEETGDEEYFERCHDAAERMEQLLDDLLTLARDEEHSIETEPVALAERVDDCWKNVETGPATIETRVDERLDADENRLNQLLENLFRNAVEHAGPEVTVTVGSLDDRAGFYVADDGPGIPEAERQAVFEQGYTGTQGGTGFGLAIVEQVVDDHGWEIEITEGETGGARFEIETT